MLYGGLYPVGVSYFILELVGHGGGREQLLKLRIVGIGSLRQHARRRQPHEHVVGRQRAGRLQAPAHVRRGNVDGADGAARASDPAGERGAAADGERVGDGVEGGQNEGS